MILFLYLYKGFNCSVLFLLLKGVCIKEKQRVNLCYLAEARRATPSVIPLPLTMHPYIEHKVFRGEHSDSVNSVSFSPCGKYLASASSDCSACIWKTSCGSFLFRVVFQSPVNALLWHPAREGTLICGCEDGTVLSMSNFTPVRSFETSVVDALYLRKYIRTDTRESISGLASLPPSFAWILKHRLSS